MADNYIFDLDPGVTRTPVSYTNRYAITISADLYRPAEFDESRRYPTDRMPFDELEKFFTANRASGTTPVAGAATVGA